MIKRLQCGDIWNMKLPTITVNLPTRLLSLASCLLVLTGCELFRAPDPNPSDAFVFPSENANRPVAASPEASTPPGALASSETTLARASSAIASESFYLRVGEPLTITFSDIPGPPSPPHMVRIRDDGKITLPYNVTVVAAGKTAGQLEENIHDEYVPRIYKQVTVSVRPDARFYFVGGQVRTPNRYEYLGKVTVLRAIDTAQGFTDFANKKKIELRRATGQRHVINWNKAVQDARYDLTVFPDDQIIVHRKIF